MIGTALIVLALTASVQCLLVVKLADRMSPNAVTGGNGRQIDLSQAGQHPRFA